MSIQSLQQTAAAISVFGSSSLTVAAAAAELGRSAAEVAEAMAFCGWVERVLLPGKGALLIERRIMKGIDRTSKVLLALLTVGVWGLLLRPLVSPGPAPAEPPKAAVQTFDEINVGRINIVGPDGKRRIILSHQAVNAPFGGKELKRTVPPGFAAIVFCNPNGDEVGGIGFGGTEKSSNGLIALDYTGVPLEAIGLSRRKVGDNESAFLVVADTPRRERLDLPKLLGELEDGKPGAQVKELQAQMRKRVELGVENHNAALRLYDRQGRPRVVIRVDDQDQPRIEVLDEKGKAIARMPAD